MVQNWIVATSAVVAAVAVWTNLRLRKENQELRERIDSSVTKDTADRKDTGTNPDSIQQKDIVDDTTNATSDFVMKPIGAVSSPFPQRAGCPRQGGTLVPHIRSHLVLDVPMEMVDRLETYSHVWIVFCFHLNPRGKARGPKRTTGKTTKTKNNDNDTKKGGNYHQQFTATKIKPPRAGGQKVGVLATRAPHRPNPVGLSVAFLEDITTVVGKGGRKRACLVLRGLDLVDGTPVYDVKPYVPWDSISATTTSTTAIAEQTVNNMDNNNNNNTSPLTPATALIERMNVLRVPAWVSADDALAKVVWSDDATTSFEQMASTMKILYPDADEMKEAIAEIVAQDPRALHDGRGKSTPDAFEFTFGQLRVGFRIQTGTATIEHVLLDQGDLAAQPGSYPHNLALRRQAEQRSNHKVPWADPVREGITTGLWELKDGSVFDHYSAVKQS